MNRLDRRRFEACLRALEGGASLEDCLSRYPKAAPRLRPLLEAALLARSLALPVDSKAQAQSRAMFLSAAVGPSLAKLPKLGLSFGRLAYTLAVAAGALVLGSFGLARASQPALPGQPLYSVKLAAEDLQYALSPNHEELERVFRQRRLNEVRQLLDAGMSQEVTFEGILTGQTEDRWTVSGIEVVVHAGTRIEGEPAVGRLLQVRGLSRPEGVVLAVEITALAEAPIETPVPAPTNTPLPPELTSTETLAPTDTPMPLSEPSASSTLAPQPTGTPDPSETEEEGEDETETAAPDPTETDEEGEDRTETAAPDPTETEEEGEDGTETATPLGSATPGSSPTPTPTPPGPSPTPTPSETEDPDHVSFEGIVESRGPAFWLISGWTVYLTAETEIRDDPQVGQRVRVDAFLYWDGRLEAERIELDPSGEGA